MLSSEIKRYLEEQAVPYSLISHSPTYTASQTAEAAHVSGKHMAKVVVVKLDGKFAIMALPANSQLDLASCKNQLKAKQLELAHEYEFNDKFPGCDVGAMPPFGDLFGMEVFLAESLKGRDWVVFNGGNHSDLIQMSSSDFLKLVHPKSLAKC